MSKELQTSESVIALIIEIAGPEAANRHGACPGCAPRLIQECNYCKFGSDNPGDRFQPRYPDYPRMYAAIFRDVKMAQR